jgi:CBS domain-containing protein
MPERTVIQAITQRHLVSLGPTATAHQGACVMTRENCGSVLIIDGSELAGIVTERDMMTRVLAKGLDAEATPLSEIMTRNPICIPPETRVAEAVVIMIERGFRHLPIVNAAKKVVGVFSVRDALPREVDMAASVAEFNEQVNDALG